MGFSRPKDGNPSTRFYENPEIIATFDPVRTWLTRNHKKYTQAEPPTNKSLATLCFQLLQFQESTMLRSSKQFIKLPAQCFMDFKPGGGLCHIFLTCLKFRYDHNWKKIDLSSSSRLDKHLEMLACIERELIASKCWSKPAVHIAASVDKVLVARIHDAAKRLHVPVVDLASEATHILHPPPSNWTGDSHEDSSTQRFRVIFQEGRGVLLHWLYSPGSHTTWYTGLQMEWPCEVESAPRPENDRPWDVDARWLLYSDEHTEWMVEEDFLLPTGSLRPRATYTPDEFLATAAAVACASSSSSVSLPTAHYSVSSNTPSMNLLEHSVKKKRRRSPSPSVSDSISTPGIHKKRRPGSSNANEKSSRHSVGHNSHRKVKKEEEDETSCQTAPSDTITEETDLTKDFDDPEPVHKIFAAPVGNGIPAASVNSRSSRVGPSTDVSASKSIFFDLDEDNDTGDGLECPGAAVNLNDPVVDTSVAQSDDLRQSGAAGAHTDLSVTEQAHCIVIPSYSAWFDYNAIHGIERRALPEFFNNQNKSKTPEVYLAYRNFMVDTYRLNPQEYLTFTACRRNLTGDVCSILRVHAFLEQWGLINYQVAAPLTASSSGLSGGVASGNTAAEAARLAVAASLGPPSTAHFHILADSVSGLQPIGTQNQTAMASSGTGQSNNPSDAAADPMKSAAIKEPNDLNAAVNGLSKTETQSVEGTTVPSLTGAVQPNSKSAPSSTNGIAPDAKPPFVGDPSLRTDQYLNSPSAVRSVCPTANGDAKPVSAPDGAPQLAPNATLLKGANQGGWTDQETLLLLEALEMYRDDWNKVAEHVGSRTQEECILHFLRLPIEDAYLEGADPILNLTALANASHPLPPFSKAANPILSTVAFLAAAVDPRVAAAAAQAALTEYAKMRDEVPAGLLHEHKVRVESAVRLGQSVDPSKFGLEEVGGGKTTEPEHKTSQPPTEEEKIPSSDVDSVSKQMSVSSESHAEKAESGVLATSVSEPKDVSESEAMECQQDDAAYESCTVTSKDTDTPAEMPCVEPGKSELEGTEPREVPPQKPTELTASQDSKIAVTGTVDRICPEDTKQTHSNCLPPNPDSLGTAAACALAAAATKARHLASVEEKRIKGLVAQLVETQLKKLDIKLKQMQELEAIMEREYEMIEQMRQQLLQERQVFHMEVIKTMENRARALVHQQQQHQQAMQLQQQQQQALAQQQHPPNYGPPQAQYPTAQSLQPPGQLPPGPPQHPGYPNQLHHNAVDSRLSTPNATDPGAGMPTGQASAPPQSPSATFSPHTGGRTSPVPHQSQDEAQVHPPIGLSNDGLGDGVSITPPSDQRRDIHAGQLCSVVPPLPDQSAESTTSTAVSSPSVTRTSQADESDDLAIGSSSQGTPAPSTKHDDEVHDHRSVKTEDAIISFESTPPPSASIPVDPSHMHLDESSVRHPSDCS
ncbi:unnamed protein product [Dicrocoelium dendriticum]|nr:unnamed protein product [Dicrocoelium dendriticum]